MPLAPKDTNPRGCARVAEGKGYGNGAVDLRTWEIGVVPRKLNAAVWKLGLGFLLKNKIHFAFVPICLANFGETCDVLRNLG